jgi:hypothetical protein
LSRPTGIPADFEVIYDVVVSDISSAEREVHSALAAVRINAFREFFKISIREAVKLVQQIANKYSVDEKAEAIETEILPLLERRMRRWLRRELVSVKFVQYSDLCILRVTEQPDVTSSEAQQTAIDLRVFGDPDDPDNLEFNPFKESLKENVAKFLTLDPYSMVMVGLRLLNSEAEAYIVHVVQELKGEPPPDPLWSISSIEYEMWGDLIQDNSILLRKIKNIGPTIS